jgi:hypothetical protein
LASGLCAGQWTGSITAHAGGKNILTIEKTLSGNMGEESRKKGETI